MKRPKILSQNFKIKKAKFYAICKRTPRAHRTIVWQLLQQIRHRTAHAHTCPCVGVNQFNLVCRCQSIANQISVLCNLLASSDRVCVCLCWWCWWFFGEVNKLIEATFVPSYQENFECCFFLSRCCFEWLYCKIYSWRFYHVTYIFFKMYLFAFYETLKKNQPSNFNKSHSLSISFNLSWIEQTSPLRFSHLNPFSITFTFRALAAAFKKVYFCIRHTHTHTASSSSSWHWPWSAKLAASHPCHLTLDVLRKISLLCILFFCFFFHSR